MSATTTLPRAGRTPATSRLLKLAQVSSVALIASFGASVAFADDAPAAAASPSEQTLAPVIVTARKVEENLQKVPVSVTTYSGAQLAEQNAVKVSDVARFTPGFLTVESPSNPTSLTLSIRGQSQNDNLATLEPSVGTYIDGVYVARAYGLNADLVDISNVQVLKGPQGTLFGRNTSAGAVLLETNNPNFKAFSVDASGTYGSYNERVGSLVVNAPLIDDKLAVRAAVQIHQRDGFITDRASGAKYDNIDNTAGRLKALYTPTSDLTVVVSGEWYEYKSHGPARALTYADPAGYINLYGTYAFAGYLAPLGVNPPPASLASYIAADLSSKNTVALNTTPSTDTKTETYNASATWVKSFGTLKVTAGYRNVSSNSAIDLDGTPYQALSTVGYQTLHQSSIEGQWTSKALAGKLDYVLGGTYFTEGGSDASSSITLAGFGAPTYVGWYQGDISNKSWGIYGQGTYHFDDKFSFTGGLRWSTDDKSLGTHNYNRTLTGTPLACDIAAPGVSIANSLCLASHSDTFGANSYTAGFDYKVTPDVLVYVKASKGYRSGGENLRANGVLATFAPFKPEINHEQEAGVKSEWLEHRLRVNLSVYQNQITNAQRSLLLGVVDANGNPTGQLLTELYNAQKAENQGMEVEATAVVTSHLELIATGNLNDSKYVEYLQPAAFGGPPSVSHKTDHFTGAPDSSYTFAAQYKRNLDFGKLTARLDYSWTNKYFNAPDVNNAGAMPSITTPAAGIVGFRTGVTFADGKYDVSIWGRNVTNNRDFISSLYVGAPLGMTSGVRRDPATFGVTGTAKF